jgi:spermidine synthase
MSAWKEFSKRRGERISYEVTDTLLEQTTAYQELGIYDTVSHGRALFLDGKIQSAESDEFIYHEALVHPALVCHPYPRRVLIAGGGEGATLREVLRHITVEEAVMVDLDAEVVAAAKRYLGKWSAGAFEDRRTRLVHADARAYLEASDEPFDAVIVDVTDPLAGGPSYRLFTREFYRLVYERLSPGGTVAVQAESADVGVIEGHLAIARTVASIFHYSQGYHTHVPSFAEAWGFVLGCKPDRQGLAVHPAGLTPEAVDAVLAQRRCAGLRFYDGLTHRRLFTPPKYERQATSPAGPIITDDQPLVVE